MTHLVNLPTKGSFKILKRDFGSHFHESATNNGMSKMACSSHYFVRETKQEPGTIAGL